MSLFGYMGLLDLGLKSSVTRFIAFNHGKGEQAYSQYIYRVALKFMTALGMIGAVIAIVFAVFYPELLAEESSKIEQYQLFLVLIAITSMITMPGNVIESCFDGFHLYAKKAKIMIPLLIVANTLMFFLITPENALLILPLSGILVATVKYISMYVILFKHYRFLFKSPKKNSNFHYTELFKFSFKSFIQNAAYKIQSTISPILIATVLSPASVVYFIVCQSLIKHKRNIEMTITQPFLPYFSAAVSKNKIDHDAYCQATKLILLVTLPISVGILLMGKEFLSLWLGSEYGETAGIILIILCISNILGSLDPLNGKILVASNNHAIFAKLTPVAVFLNIGLSLVLLNKLGLKGIAISQLCIALIFPMLYTWYRCRVFNIAISRFFSRAVLPTVFPLVVMMFFTLLMKTYFLNTNFFSFIFIALTSSIVYLITVYIFSLNKNEKEKISKKFRR